MTSGQWGETLIGPKGGIQKPTQTASDIVILARDEPYVDHTRPRKALTQAQLEIRLNKNSEKTLL